MRSILLSDGGRAETVRWLLALLAVGVPLLLGQQTTALIVQPLGVRGDLPNTTGLLSPEQGEEGAFRWGGERVTFHLQPIGYPLYAELRVQGVRTGGEPLARVSAESGGRDLGTQEVPRSPSTLEYRLPVPELLAANPTLTLTSTTFQPPGDRRQLGLVFYSLEQRSGVGLSVPSAWPAAALLLSGLLVYLAAGAVTRKRPWALSAALFWGMAIGVLNAAARPWLVFYSWYFVVPPVLVLLLLPWVREWRRREPRDNEKTAESHPNVTENPAPIAVAVAAASVALLAWHLFAPQEPAPYDPTHNVTWGVSFYSQLPLMLQILGVLVVLGAGAWAWFAPVQWTASGVQVQPESERLPGWMVWALSLGGMAAFAALPVAYSEGDSDEFDTKIPKGAIWRERELLDFYFKVRLWWLLRPVLPLPSQVYQLVAVAAGGVYIWAASLVARVMARDRTDALVLVGGLLAVGNILLFFRYVESYAPVTALSLFVIWACWRYTEGRASFGTVGLLATVAPLFHGSALWWGPMVVAAWLVRAFQRPADARWKQSLADLRTGVFAGAAVLLSTIAVMLIDAYDYERFQAGLEEMGGADSRTMLPLFETVTRYEHYSFFSWAHLGAVVQEQLLVAPLALVAVVLVAILAWRGVLALGRAVPAMWTLAAGAAGMFFYSITWNPDLGPRDDWDLLALSALPLTLLALYLLLHMPQGRYRRLAIASYLALSAVHAGAWVALHVLGIRY
jgi:hypothetical protein